MVKILSLATTWNNISMSVNEDSRIYYWVVHESKAWEVELNILINQMEKHGIKMVLMIYMHR